jgi:hypothetical protein
VCVRGGGGVCFTFSNNLHVPSRQFAEVVLFPVRSPCQSHSPCLASTSVPTTALLPPHPFRIRRELQTRLQHLPTPPPTLCSMEPTVPQPQCPVPLPQMRVCWRFGVGGVRLEQQGANVCTAKEEVDSPQPHLEGATNQVWRS